MTALDTNVLIYACDRSDPLRQRKAVEVIGESTDGVLLWQVACEFVAASRKLRAQGFTTDQAWSRLKEFLDLFPLVLPTAATLTRAEALTREHGRLLGCDDPGCLPRGGRTDVLFGRSTRAPEDRYPEDRESVHGRGGDVLRDY